MEADVLVLEQPLVLLENSVAGLGKDFDQGGLVQFVKDAHDRQAADEFGNQAVFDQVLRLGLAQQFGIAMVAGGGRIGLGIDGS